MVTETYNGGQLEQLPAVSLPHISLLNPLVHRSRVVTETYNGGQLEQLPAVGQPSTAQPLLTQAGSPLSTKNHSTLQNSNYMCKIGLNIFIIIKHTENIACTVECRVTKHLQNRF